MAAKATSPSIGRKLYLGALGVATGWLLLVIAFWAAQLRNVPPGQVQQFSISVLGIGIAPMMTVLLIGRWLQRRSKPSR